MRKLIGTVARKDGALCIQTATNCWFPLGGNSGLAHEFELAFGPPQLGDIGKQVFRVGDVLQMENEWQREQRQMTEGAKQ